MEIEFVVFGPREDDKNRYVFRQVENEPENQPENEPEKAPGKGPETDLKTELGVGHLFRKKCVLLCSRSNIMSPKVSKSH